MESHEALKRVVGHDVQKMAKRIGRSTSLIYKWTEPHTDFSESGTLNPLDRIEVLIEAALADGRNPIDAFAPVYYLASKFNGVFLPPVPKTFQTSDYSKQLCRTIKEAGDVFVEAAKALEDDDLSARERRRVLKEIYEAIAELSTFARMFEEA